jgi:transcription-repair coupling factor (superfamily II helicase)
LRQSPGPISSGDLLSAYPEPVENLFHYARLRQETLALQIQSIERNRGQIHFRFVDHSKVSPQKLLTLVNRNKRASSSPQGLLTLELEHVPPTKPFETIHKILDQIRQTQ